MIQIAPVDNFNVEIAAEGQSFGTFDSAIAVEAMENLNAEYPGQCELVINRWGYKASFAIIEKALDLAGIVSAKDRAIIANSGKVVF